MDTTIAIDGRLVAALVECLDYMKQFNPRQTEEQEQWHASAARCSSAAIGILNIAAQRNNYNSTLAGQHTVDPTKSPFM